MLFYNADYLRFVPCLRSTNLYSRRRVTMKRCHLLLMILTPVFMFLCAIPAYSLPGDVVKKVVLPFHHPTGIAWDGKILWVADRLSDKFYKLDCSKGELLDSIPSPAYFPSGLAWDGKLLWSTDPAAKKIYATDPSKRLTVKTLDSPSPSPMGIATDGKYLWISDNRTDMIAKIDPEDGTTIVSFRAPSGDVRGITFGRGYLWCTDRIRDQIYMVEPETGTVVMVLPAPGRFSWGLTWQDNFLLNSDYQDDVIYKIVTKDDEYFEKYFERVARVNFRTDAVAMGSGVVNRLNIFYAVPENRPNQVLLNKPTFTPKPKEFKKDRWGQRVAIYEFENLKPGETISVNMRVELKSYAVRYYIYPEDVGEKIPEKISKLFLADDVKYDIKNPYIQKIVKEVVGNEENLYWKARKLFQHLISHMEYEMVGGWNTAPTVLKRGNGSCSEYSFSYIALCRAAGVPARYVGSLVVRGDDASYDSVFHRWCEIYLPGYGWIPVDANAGDRDWPADQASAFGGISNRFLITTEGGGGSEYLGWNYNVDAKWLASGKATVFLDSNAEWEPLEK